MKRKKINDPVLGFRWYFQIGASEDSAYSWYCKAFNIPKPEPHTIAESVHSGSFGSNKDIAFSGLIWIADKQGGTTMAHECAHAANNVCRVLELDPREADEFHASYCGYLFRELNKLFYKKKSK